MDRPSWGWATCLIAVLVLYRHRSNISRLSSGKEPAIGEKAQPQQSGQVQTAKQPENSEGGR